MTAQPLATSERAISAPTRLPAPVTIAVRLAVMESVPALSRAAKQSKDIAMPESRPPIELKGLNLSELQRLIDERRLPAVEKWNPEHCGHSGMRIARDGTWFHDGSPIQRPAMVRLFASVLRREPDGSHVLVTPMEKLTIEVEATAFRATQMTMAGEHEQRRIGLTLDSGDAL